MFDLWFLSFEICFWCMMFDFRLWIFAYDLYFCFRDLFFDSWMLTFGFRFLNCVVWVSTLDFGFLVFGLWFLNLWIWYVSFDFWFLVFKFWIWSRLSAIRKRTRRKILESKRLPAPPDPTNASLRQWGDVDAAAPVYSFNIILYQIGAVFAVVTV